MEEELKAKAIAEQAGGRSKRGNTLTKMKSFPDGREETGRLTGKVRRGQPLPEVSRQRSAISNEMGPQVSDDYLYKVADALDEVAAETGKTVPQIALNWLLQRPTVATVVIGAPNEEQLRQNLGAVGWNLSADQVRKLDAASAVPMIYPYWHQKLFKRSTRLGHREARSDHHSPI